MCKLLSTTSALGKYNGYRRLRVIKPRGYSGVSVNSVFLVCDWSKTLRSRNSDGTVIRHITHRKTLLMLLMCIDVNCVFLNGLK